MIVLEKVRTVNEIKELSQLATTIFNEVYATHVSLSHISHYLKSYQSLEAITLQLKNNYSYYFIKKESRCIGYIGLIFLGDRMEISKLYLKKGERGKGAGDFIIEWIEDFAEDHDLKEIELFVLRQNEVAIKFYQRHGFVFSELISHHFETGDYEENYKMLKKLNVRTAREF